MAGAHTAARGFAAAKTAMVRKIDASSLVSIGVRVLLEMPSFARVRSYLRPIERRRIGPTDVREERVDRIGFEPHGGPAGTRRVTTHVKVQFLYGIDSSADNVVSWAESSRIRFSRC